MMDLDRPMSAHHDDEDDVIEASPEEVSLARSLAAKTKADLWTMLVDGEPIPGKWYCYHIGYLHVRGEVAGAVARELVKRGLADLAQRRGKRGFSYLIAKRKVPRGADLSKPLSARHSATSPSVPVPSLTRSDLVKRILAADDRGLSVMQIAKEVGSYYQAVHGTLTRYGRLGKRPETSAGKIG